MNSRRLAATARSAANGFMLTPIETPPATSTTRDTWAGQLNIEFLYGMVAMLSLAILFPPWETPPSQAPEFLGLHFILTPTDTGCHRKPIAADDRTRHHRHRRAVRFVPLPAKTLTGC